MAPDYSVNTKGLALESTAEFLITYILTFGCVILFVIPMVEENIPKTKAQSDQLSDSDTPDEEADP